jgi:leucine-zipper of insertion element IS481
MNAHKNARTTPFGRAVMVRRVREEGWSVAAVAATFEISPRTVCKWLARFGGEGDAGLQTRSSAPHLISSPMLVGPSVAFTSRPWGGPLIRVACLPCSRRSARQDQDHWALRRGWRASIPT